MKKSANKQSQAETIQRTITSRNVIQDNGDINNFWKGNHWFCCQCLMTYCYFFRQESRKWLFEKLHLCPSISAQTSPNWPSVLHLLHALPVAVLAIPVNSTVRANHAKTAKHSHSRLSCVFSDMHIFTLKKWQVDVFKSLFLKESVWLLAGNSHLTFLIQLKFSDFWSFALIISSDESQSKAQFNLKSVGKYKLVVMLKNILFPQMQI